MVKIAYDAGHGKNTPGKRTPDGEREWMFNDILLKGFESEIKKYEGVELLRTDDTTGKNDIPLKNRTDSANAWGADYYISFHHNANTGTWGNWSGVEAFVQKGGNPKSKQLADSVLLALVKGYGLTNRGVKESNLHITRETKMPAILIEGGFMDSVIDIKVLRNSEKLKNSGKLIAQAVANHLKLQLKERTPVDKPQVVSEWAKESFEWAKKEGIIDGTRPKDTLTREEFAVTLKRLFDKLNK